MYSRIMEKLEHVATKTELVEHSVDCPAQKKHRILIWVGSLISGASFIGGVVFMKLMTQ
jgi:hypothetical protein